jgi:hypothetical protein
MNSKIYFEDYYPGKLHNQRLLSKFLKGVGSSIETDDANPMTIRLLVTVDNLYMIKSLAYQWKSSGLSEFIVSENRSRGPMVSGALSYEVFGQPGNHKNKTINLIDVHKVIFGFFSNLSSAMDRLAYEIKNVYKIQDEGIGWSYFFGKTPRISIPLLEQIVNSHDKAKIKWIIQCRNRLLHDGILRFELNSSICLPEYPRDSKSKWLPMETECDKAFWEIVDIIDAI